MPCLDSNLEKGEEERSEKEKKEDNRSDRQAASLRNSVLIRGGGVHKLINLPEQRERSATAPELYFQDSPHGECGWGYLWEFAVRCLWQ